MEQIGSIRTSFYDPRHPVDEYDEQSFSEVRRHSRPCFSVKDCPLTFRAACIHICSSTDDIGEPSRGVFVSGIWIDNNVMCPRIVPLTCSERMSLATWQCLCLHASGASTDLAATELRYSKGTVRNYLVRGKRLLGVCSRQEVLRLLLSNCSTPCAGS